MKIYFLARPKVGKKADTKRFPCWEEFFATEHLASFGNTYLLLIFANIMDQKNTTPQELSDIKAMIAKDFSLELPEEMDMQALFDMVANEVAYMIEHSIEQLMSMLYRLDVLEPHINHALSPLCPDPANIAIAKLILERQARRWKTKQQYKVDKDLDLGDLAY